MPDKNIFNDRALYQKAFLILLVVFVSAVFFSMVRSFLTTILLAGIFSGLMSPLYRRMLKFFRGRRGVASAVTLVAMLLVVIVPLVLLLTIVTGQAVKITNAAGPWVQEQVSNPDMIVERLQRLPGFERVEPYRAEIITRLGQLVGSVGNFVVASLSSMTRGTVTFLFHAFLMLYAMFFFLMDGHKLLERMMYYSPLPREAEARMAEKFVSVSRATIKGTLVIGVIQGTLAGIGLAVAGIPSAVFWSALMTVLSIIPGIGTALVWVPAAIYLFATGHPAAGVLLTLWCGLLVGSVDNVLRPRLVGRDTQMHDLLILFSTLGGLLLFGVVGIIIGPIVAALFVAVWDLYGIVFKDLLPRRGQ